MSNTTPHPNRLGHFLNPLKRARTPILHDDASAAGESTAEKEVNPHQERRQRLMRDQYARSERIIKRVGTSGPSNEFTKQTACSDCDRQQALAGPAQVKAAPQSRKRAAREIAEKEAKRP